MINLTDKKKGAQTQKSTSNGVHKATFSHFFNTVSKFSGFPNTYHLE